MNKKRMMFILNFKNKTMTDETQKNFMIETQKQFYQSQQKNFQKKYV